MITDLVSPWLAAVESGVSPDARAAFRRAHAPLLDLLAHQRRPLGGEFPATPDLTRLHAAQRLATDPALRQALGEARATAVGLGADCPAAIVLVPGDDSESPVEALPHPAPAVALVVDGELGIAELAAALVRGLALLTRWSDAESASPVRGRSAPWDRWQLAMELPLAEWIYAEGLALHVVAAAFPAWTAPRLLGVSPSHYQRLRERERALRGLLSIDLDRTGIEAVNRWLAWSAAAPEPGIPAAAGRYLAWRLTAESVATAGLRRALRLSADPGG